MTEREKTYPFSLRLTKAERIELEKRAAGLSLGTYIRERLFDSNCYKPQRRTRGRFPVKDHKALAQILALLGKSQAAHDFNQLAKAASIGALPVTSETETAILEATQNVKIIKSMLMAALGIQER